MHFMYVYNSLPYVTFLTSEHAFLQATDLFLCCLIGRLPEQIFHKFRHKGMFLQSNLIMNKLVCPG
jgi:hypothetical protein